MGLPVVAHIARPVDAEHHRQILHADIEDHFIISPLKEGGIDGHKGAFPLQGQSAGKTDRMLLCDSHVKDPFREQFDHGFQSGSVQHRCTDSCDSLIFQGHFRQFLPEYMGPAGIRCAADWFHGFRIKRTDAVKLVRILFDDLIAFSLLRHDVKDHRTIDSFHRFQEIHQLLNVMAIDGAVEL